jgi:IS5 family transposase
VKQGSDGKQKTTYGYKAHMNVEEDGFIKTYAVTAGNVHDSRVFEELLTGTETQAYADSAYKSQAHDALLAKHCIDNRILKRGYRNTPLSEQDKRKNQHYASTRTVIERVFGVQKLHQAMSKSRYLGLIRNKAWIGLLSIAHNLKRGVMLHRCCYS